jgi:hypothetical protein
MQWQRIELEAKITLMKKFIYNAAIQLEAMDSTDRHIHRALRALRAAEGVK